MHPDVEVHHLISISRACEQLAQSGRTEEGHRRLRVGLCRAEALQQAGAFWSSQLLLLWRCALRDFRTRYAQDAEGEGMELRSGRN